MAGASITIERSTRAEDGQQQADHGQQDQQDEKYPKKQACKGHLPVSNDSFDAQAKRDGQAWVPGSLQGRSPVVGDQLGALAIL